jgi:hypothetical protein
MLSALSRLVKYRLPATLALTLCLPQVWSATLQRLSLDDMIGQSTVIVRAKVKSSYAAYSGPIVYTHYSIQVSENLKGGAGNTLDVVVPGGSVNGMRQSFAGTPTFNAGDEYVFFLWTGKSGLTQVMGLTQGLFSVASDGSTDPMLTRAASRELMLDSATGRPVADQPMSMHASDLRLRIATKLGASSK